MKRDLERKYLLLVLLILSLGFLVVYSGFIDREVPTTLLTASGQLDISGYFITFFPNALYATFFVAVFLLAHLYLRLALPEADPFVLPVVALLSGIGLIMTLRLSPDLAISRNTAIRYILSRNPDAHATDNVLALAQLGKKQFVFVLSGVVIMLATLTMLNARRISWFSSKKYLWVFCSALLIAATLFFGRNINGKSLWLFGFQTVEAVKIMMLLFIAGYVYEKGKGLEMYGRKGSGSWLRYAGPFGMMWFFGLIPLFIQKDLGPTFVLFAVFLIMFYYSGNPKSVTLFLILLVFAGGYISYKVGYPSIVRTRFDMFLDPFGRSESLSRVLWSISSGGVTGAGIGYGMPFRIPEVQSDFSFAAICEEMGIIGAIVIILAFAIFIQRCLKIASSARNSYTRTLVTGIAVLTAVQAFVIVGGNLGFLPMTGITLPFVSYGGSSLIMNFLMAGIVLRISGEKG